MITAGNTLTMITCTATLIKVKHCFNSVSLCHVYTILSLASVHQGGKCSQRKSNIDLQEEPTNSFYMACFHRTEKGRCTDMALLRISRFKVRGEISYSDIMEMWLKHTHTHTHTLLQCQFQVGRFILMTVKHWEFQGRG